ncbi:MAG: queuosine precursor transporter [Gammaproteobacteria bacterium]
MQQILNKASLPDIQHGIKGTQCIRSNYLLGIAMFYMMFPMVTGLLVYKIISFGPFKSAAGIMVTPLVYCLSNITTEVYGYEVSRNMMWWFIAASITFVTLCGICVQIPSPETFQHQAAYDLILGGMPLICVAGTIGTICALSFNNYFLSKLKIKMQGRAYWLRSIISTSPGEVVFNLVAYPIMFYGKIPFSEIIQIFISVSLFKICATAFFTPLEWFIANYLKQKEGINTFDYGVNYDVFKIGISKEKPTLKVVNS